MSFIVVIKYILFYIVGPAIIFILVFHPLRDYGFYKFEAVISRDVSYEQAEATYCSHR